MTLSSGLRNALRAALAEVLAEGGGDAAHDLAHADCVWMNARVIALGEGRDPSPVLMAASYLHDLVVLPETHPDRARSSALSAMAAGPVMEALGFTAREIAAARHAIEAQSLAASAEPLLPEAVILRDAVLLGALGAVGIARAFAVAGAAGGDLFDPADPFARTRTADVGAYALDRVLDNHLTLPRAMLTATGRRLAAERLTAFHRWLGDLAGELQAPPPAR